MKSKKILIISLATILLVATLVMVAMPVFATKDPKTFTATEFNNADANNIVGKIMGFVQWIGSAIAVIILIVIGIKYMVGSAEEKAEYKKTFVPYIVGAILIFAAANIASFVYNAVKQ